MPAATPGLCRNPARSSRRPYLGAIKTSDAGARDPTVLVEGQPIYLAIDIGAEETIHPTQVFETLKNRPVLSAPLRQLPPGPDGNLLTAAGMAKIKLICRNPVSIQNVYVLDGICTPVLGKRTIEELWILMFVNAASDEVNPKEEFPAALQGNGKLHREHEIQLQTGAKELLAADTLSKAPLRDTGDTELEENMEAFLWLIDKCIAVPRRKTQELAQQIIYLYIEIEKQRVVVKKLLQELDNKNPKIVSGCLKTLRECLRLFGARVIQVKPLLKPLPKLLERKDKTVREESKQLTFELYRWIGDALQPHLQSLKPFLVSELRAVFAKVDKRTASPERFTRSEQA
ncbi:hypothetical protein HPB50_011473 [Hyalomma asiaticum]|uniref:Uncharacterized protein n=1 Tax=Hyalomma asiaticum TaxID=266040 RepID=A0ACB7TMK9_HYAAI|nr:hypothetical protein HPB50_011473 [Hyalomma asiaticum]